MTFGYCPDPFGAWWPEVLALLIPALERDAENDQVEMEVQLASRRAQLWLVVDPAPVAALVTRDGDNEFEIWLAGGRILSVLQWLPVIEAAFRETGKVRGRLCGRAGWARVLKPFGWHRESDDLVKELTHDE